MNMLALFLHPHAIKCGKKLTIQVNINRQIMERLQCVSEEGTFLVTKVSS